MYNQNQPFYYSPKDQSILKIRRHLLIAIVFGGLLNLLLLFTCYLIFQNSSEEAKALRDIDEYIRLIFTAYILIPTLSFIAILLTITELHSFKQRWKEAVPQSVHKRLILARIINILPLVIVLIFSCILTTFAK